MPPRFDISDLENRAMDSAEESYSPRSETTPASPGINYSLPRADRMLVSENSNPLSTPCPGRSNLRDPTSSSSITNTQSSGTEPKPPSARERRHRLRQSRNASRNRTETRTSPEGLKITHYLSTNLEFVAYSVDKATSFFTWWKDTPHGHDHPSHKVGLSHRTSRVWCTFVEGAMYPTGVPKVQCTNCKELMAHPTWPKPNGNTALNNHLRSKGCGSPDRRVKRSVLELQQQHEMDFSEKGFARQILSFIVACRLPLATTDNAMFRRLLSNAAFGRLSRSIPNRQKLALMLKEHASTELQQHLVKLPKHGKLSIVFDLWTSPRQYAFLGVVAYWIDSDWQYQEMLIGFEHITGQSNAENISTGLVDVIRHHDLGPRVLALTADNAAVNAKTAQYVRDRLHSHEYLGPIRDAGVEEILAAAEHIPCLAHIINIVLQQLLRHLKMAAQNDNIEYVWDVKKESLTCQTQGVAGAAEKLRKLAKFVRASSRRKAFWSELCSEDSTHVELQLDCRTRWNSTYVMITRAQRVKPMIRQFIRQWKPQDLKGLQLNAEEWRHIGYLIELLYPFYRLTMTMSSTHEPNIHQVLDTFDRLFDHLEDSINKLKRKTVPWKQELRRALEEAKNKLQTHYAKTHGPIGSILAVATILNPKIKDRKFREASYQDDTVDWHGKYLDLLQRLCLYYRRVYPHLLDQCVDSMSGLDMWDQALGHSHQEIPTADAEIQQYLDDGLQKNMKILDFWKAHERKYPTLAMIARDILSLAGTSVGVERVFNSARDVCHYRRGKLDPSTIRDLMLFMCGERFTLKEEFHRLEEELDEDQLNELETQRQDDMAQKMALECDPTGYISDDEGQSRPRPTQSQSRYSLADDAASLFVDGNIMDEELEEDMEQDDMYECW